MKIFKRILKVIGWLVLVGLVIGVLVALRHFNIDVIGLIYDGIKNLIGG